MKSEQSSSDVSDDQNEHVSRRGFMKQAAAGAAAAGVAATNARADVVKNILPSTIIGANERIHTGHIGLGGMGKNNLRFAMLRDDVVPIQMCDVWKDHREQGADIAEHKYGRPATTNYFEEVIENKDVDAVVISTPDHWHALPAIMACEAGKDVYCEKPLTTTMREGQALVKAVRANDTVLQMGTMQRSGTHFQEAVELVRSGHIGPVARVETWSHDNKAINLFADADDGTAPDGLDWERFVGWTRKVPFNKNRWIHSFRWFLDYSGGELTDWGTHLVDIVVWAMGQDKPVRSVMGSSGKFVMEGNTTTPDTVDILWEFDDYHLSFSNRMWNPMPMGRGIQYGIMFHGTLGTLQIDRRGYRVYSFRHNGGCEERQVKDQREMTLNANHWENFVDCIRSRKDPICDVDTGYNSTKICHIGTAAYVAGGRLDWDDEAERFRGVDTEAVAKANDFAYRPYENGWSLESPHHESWA